MAHLPDDFVGTWALADWRIEYSDGGVTRPFGDAPQGYIIYSGDGMMSASIARTARAKFGLANARNAGAEQKSAAFDSYFHYAGSWQVNGDHVVHRLAMALNPDMAGTEQRRLAEFDGTASLTLSALEPQKDGTSRRHVIQWIRPAAPQRTP